MGLCVCVCVCVCVCAGCVLCVGCVLCFRLILNLLCRMLMFHRLSVLRAPVLPLFVAYDAETFFHNDYVVSLLPLNQAVWLHLVLLDADVP